MVKGLEIVGLHTGNYHRSCCLHKICGVTVKVGDRLRLVTCMVDLEEGMEEGNSLLKIKDETHTCTVAYVPRAYLSSRYIQDRVDDVVEVVELYKDSTSIIKQQQCNQKNGMALCHFIDDTFALPNNYE
jgi:hypothetical protein